MASQCEPAGELEESTRSSEATTTHSTTVRLTRVREGFIGGEGERVGERGRGREVVESGREGAAQ